MHANLNPFAGTQIPNIPPQPTSHTSAQSPIAERIIMLRQLCDDRMLLIWADGSGKVLHRDRSTNRFLLPMSEANDRLIWGLISS